MSTDDVRPAVPMMSSVPGVVAPHTVVVLRSAAGVTDGGTSRLDASLDMFLSPAERTTWAGLESAGPRRQRQWLLGRRAAKDAARELVSASFGVEIAPVDIAVTADHSGAPTVAVPLDGGVTKVQVSISHSGDVGAAICCLDHRVRAVGIDIEQVRPRRALESKGLTDGEVELLIGLESAPRAELALRFWTAKEAAVKSLGVNFDQAGGPRSVRVTPVAGDGGNVTVDIAASSATASRRLTAVTSRVGDLVVAIVVDIGDL